jgi:hypothetical protein
MKKTKGGSDVRSSCMSKQQLTAGDVRLVMEVVHHHATKRGELPPGFAIARDGEEGHVVTRAGRNGKRAKLSLPKVLRRGVDGNIRAEAIAEAPDLLPRTSAAWALAELAASFVTAGLIG